jgi:hypothetical protein
VSIRNRWNGAIVCILGDGTLRHWPTLFENDDEMNQFRPVVT